MLEFEDGLKTIVGYFNDPATILTRWQGNAELEIVDEETANITVSESAISAGLDISSSFFTETDKNQLRLEDFTTGFIKGRLSRIIADEIAVTEITDYSEGSNLSKYQITMD